MAVRGSDFNFKIVTAFTLVGIKVPLKLSICFYTYINICMAKHNVQSSCTLSYLLRTKTFLLPYGIESSLRVLMTERSVTRIDFGNFSADLAITQLIVSVGLKLVTIYFRRLVIFNCIYLIVLAGLWRCFFFLQKRSRYFILQ